MAEELVSTPAAEQQAAPPPERRPRRPLWYRVKDFLPAISGVAAAISAACAVVSAYYAIQSRTFVQEQSQQQREQARQQRVARAWDVLNAHGHDSANAGQAEALETLYREGASLRQLNLAGCYLYGVKLPNADLELANFGQTDTWPPTRAILRKADLGRVKLRAAVLSGAELVEANLSGADLQGALLKEADLQGADLSGAELQGADLRSSKLSGAELGGTNFSNADTGYAHFEGNDFRGTLGLTKNQIQSAHTWILGHYSEAMLLELGMPPDHEDRLKNRGLYRTRHKPGRLHKRQKSYAI